MPVSILPLFFKVFEKAMYKQLYDYMKEPLNQSRCSFCKAHLTQHAPFKLLLLWQKEFGSRKS